MDHIARAVHAAEVTAWEAAQTYALIAIAEEMRAANETTRALINGR